MQPAPALTPSRIVGDLLASHPEAAALLAEASHRQALAAHSAAAAGQTFAAEQAARLRHQELRHLLDPRRRRGIHLGAGLVLLAAAAAGLAVLDRVELGGVLGKPLATQVAIAAAAVWLAGAWSAALASREGRRGLVAALAAAAAALALLLAALHGLGSSQASTGGSSTGGWSNTGLGVLAAGLIGGLATGAAALIGRLESASVLLARCRWRRLAAEHQAAVRQARADAEAAAISATAWLGLVRRQVAAAGCGTDGHLAQATLLLAAALHEPCRPRLP
ncbi:MAG: hypothetical protein ACLPN6_13760 [Streptosporangiaceae bacterium]